MDLFGYSTCSLLIGWQFRGMWWFWAASCMRLDRCGVQMQPVVIWTKWGPDPCVGFFLITYYSLFFFTCTGLLGAASQQVSKNSLSVYYVWPGNKWSACLVTYRLNSFLKRKKVYAGAWAEPAASPGGPWTTLEFGRFLKTIYYFTAQTDEST